MTKKSKRTATPTVSVRELCAQVIQLCHYVEDLRVEKKLLKLADYTVLSKKAAIVRAAVDLLKG